MSHSRSSRRDFLRAVACAACSGGAAALLPQLRMMGTALAGTPLSGYKAIVCLYLAGGNDSWNLVVPHDAARFDVYSTARNGVFSSSNPGGLGLANPADGILREPALEPLDVVAAQHLRYAGIDRARTYAIDADSVFRIFQRRPSPEVDDAGLGRVVSRHPIVAGRARD